jgi:hypothetical protein
MDKIENKYAEEQTNFRLENEKFRVAWEEYSKYEEDRKKGAWGCLVPLISGSAIVIIPLLGNGSSRTVWPIWWIAVAALVLGWWLYVGGRKTGTQRAEPKAPVTPKKGIPAEVELSVVKNRTDNEDVPFADYRKRVILRDNYECQVCGAKKAPQNLEVHHVISQARGGSDYLSNLVTLCIRCHEKEIWFGHHHKQRK